MELNLKEKNFNKYQINLVSNFLKKKCSFISENGNSRIQGVTNDNFELYFEILKEEEEYRFIFDILNYEKSTNDNLISFKYEKTQEDIYVTFLLPTGGSVNIENGSINFQGKTYPTGHKAFVCVATNFEVKTIEPILGNNKFYPENYICGIKIEGQEDKIIVFLHKENILLEKFKDKYNFKKILFSIFKFKNTSLENVWYLNEKKENLFGRFVCQKFMDK